MRILAQFATRLPLLPIVLAIASPRIISAAPTTEPTLKQLRREFQSQEFTIARPFSYIFSVGEVPRIIWRDADRVRELGSDGRLRVRWFDANLAEAKAPDHPGRWSAYIEATAPNGTPVRRALTLYCRAPGEFLFWPAGSSLTIPPGLGGEVWAEHQAEISRSANDMVFGGIHDSEAGAILIAGLSEMKPMGRPALSSETAAALNDDFQFKVKLHAEKLADKVRALAPPQKKTGTPAPIIRNASLAEAGMRDDAKSRIDAVCRDWAADSAEPFVTLVARHGVIVTHASFGQDASGKPLPLDFRNDVASITKNTTAMLFARFVDQGLIDLDESVADVFPDYPHDSAHVPTFRQCLTHMSGLSGHGDFGGARNAHLENILLNGIDTNEPGKKYDYSGMGFDLTAKTMEIVAGRSFVPLYREQLFGPLGIGDVPLTGASSGAQYTAGQLAVLAQLQANRGSYGDKVYFSPATFEKLLPEQLRDRYPGVVEVEGIGMHWMHTPKPGRPAGSKDPNDWILGPRTIGHGSLTSCMFMIDLDHDLIIVQIRKQAGPRYGEWSAKFLQAIMDGVTP